MGTFEDYMKTGEKFKLRPKQSRADNRLGTMLLDTLKLKTSTLVAAQLFSVSLIQL